VISFRILPLTRGAKTVERPGILGFVVAEHVIITVIGSDAKIAGSGGVPTPVELADLKLASPKDEPKRPLVGAVPRITLDANFVHRASAGSKGWPPLKNFKPDTSVSVRRAM
jgi:hypothetical protein